MAGNNFVLDLMVYMYDVSARDWDSPGLYCRTQISV